jgi:hypothetical protein
VEGRKSRKLGGPNRVLLLLHFIMFSVRKHDLVPVDLGQSKTIHVVELMCFNLPGATCLGNQVEFRHQFVGLNS